ncbi:MAG: ribosome maturation factor RimM [Lachnospiraceae bacterium]|nr:ribosome maturation factor RimM [Lachnospiraceae bacterium]
METEFQVGAITSTHGVRGEVKVFPTTDDPDKFHKLKSVRVRTEKGTEQTLEITQVKFFKNLAILKFKGIDTMDEAQKLYHATLWVDRADAVPLGENEYYRADLMGMQVVTEDGEDFGTLTNIYETGANDVYEVEMADGKKVLLPAIHQCILQVDVAQAKMTIHVMDGLLD